VRELFPEFRQSSVLRFSRLFPIKPSHKPKIWKNLKRKKQSNESKKGEEIVKSDPAKQESQQHEDEPKGNEVIVKLLIIKESSKILRE